MHIVNLLLPTHLLRIVTLQILDIPRNKLKILVYVLFNLKVQRGVVIEARYPVFVDLVLIE